MRTINYEFCALFGICSFIVIYIFVYIFCTNLQLFYKKILYRLSDG